MKLCNYPQYSIPEQTTPKWTHNSEVCQALAITNLLCLTLLGFKLACTLLRREGREQQSPEDSIEGPEKGSPCPLHSTRWAETFPPFSGGLPAVFSSYLTEGKGKTIFPAKCKSDAHFI